MAPGAQIPEKLFSFFISGAFAGGYFIFVGTFIGREVYYRDISYKSLILSLWGIFSCPSCLWCLRGYPYLPGVFAVFRGPPQCVECAVKICFHVLLASLLFCCPHGHVNLQNRFVHKASSGGLALRFSWHLIILTEGSHHWHFKTPRMVS